MEAIITHHRPKILLIIPPVIYARQPLIGVAYLCSFLRSRGYEVRVLDLNTKIPISNDGDDLFWSQFESQESFFQKHRYLFEEWLKEILDYDPQIIGFTIWVTSIYISLRLAAMVKQIDKRNVIVFGGF
jgi:hypothetical protein